MLCKKNIKCKKQSEKDQQRIISFYKLYRENLQDKVFDENEYYSLCNSFNEKILMK